MDTTLGTELDKFSAARADSRTAATLAAFNEKERDRRVREGLHRENRTLYIHHHYSLAEMYAKLSADHARRAEALRGMRV